MKIASLSLILSLIAAAPLVPQTPSQDRLRADITVLTSEQLDGRLSLTPGDQLAIDRIAETFRTAKLETRLQPVPLIQYRFDRAASSLVVKGERYAIQSAMVTNNFDLKAPLVFAGFGDDYTGIDAKGKIAIVFDHEANETAAKGQWLNGHSRMKMVHAAHAGAAAILLMADPGRKHQIYAELSARRPRTSTVNGTILPQIIDEKGAIPILGISEEVGATLLRPTGSDPKELQAKIESGSKASHFKLPETIAEVQVRLSDRTEGESFNVIGVLPGSDPRLKDEAILFTGHHDHNGRVNGELMPGADDNASGTVAVMELARLFGSAPHRPKRTLIFIVFAAEERGLLGAYYYITAPVIPIAKTRAVLNFDMVGRNETHTAESKGLVDIAADTSNEMNLIGCKFHRAYCAVIEKANAQVGLTLNEKWDHDLVFNVLRRSDHLPFLLEGVPAAWWFTGFHPDYHQPTDTVEKINFVKLAKIVKLAYLSGLAMADDTRKVRGKH